MISKTQSTTLAIVLFLLCLGLPFLLGSRERPVAKSGVICEATTHHSATSASLPPLASALRRLTGESEILSALIAGLALFGLVLVSLRFVNAELATPEGMLLATLLLFNPMVGLMTETTDHASAANLIGTALAVAVLALTIRDDNAPERYRQAGLILTGILAGLVPTCIPLVILPALIAFGRSERKLTAVALLTGSIAVWLIPTIMLTGAEEWMRRAGEGIGSYFAEFNGTGNGLPDIEVRRTEFLHTLVDKGLGGYWGGTPGLSLFVSLGLLLCFARGAWWMFHRETDGLVITVACISIFIVWVMFYQVDPNQGRYALPLLPILLYPVWGGAVQLMRQGWRGRVAVSLFLAAYMAMGIFRPFGME